MSTDAILVTHNSKLFLLGAVESCLESGVEHLCVVDNASSDGTPALLRELAASHSQIDVVLNDSNRGFATACNQGLARCPGKALLFLNPDCTLGPGALARMLEVLGSDATIGMVGGFLCFPDGSEQPGGRRRFPTPVSALLRVLRWPCINHARKARTACGSFELHHQPLPENPISVDAISGACMLVRRQAIDEVGPWDEAFFLHCEDLDWCKRFQLNGWKVKFVPDAPIVHFKGASSRTRPLFVEFHKHRGMLLFYRKFYRDRYPHALWPVVWAAVWLHFIGVVAILKIRRLSHYQTETQLR